MLKRNVFSLVAAAVLAVVCGFSNPAFAGGKPTKSDPVLDAVNALRGDVQGARGDVSGLSGRVDALSRRVSTLETTPAPAASATGSPVAPAPRVVSASERDASALRAVRLEVWDITGEFASSGFGLTASEASNRLGRLEDIARVYYCAGTPPSDAAQLCKDVAEARRMGQFRLGRMLHPAVYGTVAAVAPPSEESIAKYAAVRCVLPAAIGAGAAGIMAFAAPPNRAAHNEFVLGLGTALASGVVSALLTDDSGSWWKNGLVSTACGFVGSSGVALGDLAIREDRRGPTSANIVVVR